MGPGAFQQQDLTPAQRTGLISDCLTFLCQRPRRHTETPNSTACFHIQVKVWDCNTGECLETLKVRWSYSAGQDQCRGPAEAQAWQDPPTLALCY